MRFATATALLLTQVLPTVTQEAPENSLLANAGASAGPSQLVHDFEQVVARKFHNARKLKNNSHIKPCDPQSNDLDVGILSCGMGRYCVESNESPLGGNCMPSLKKKAPTLKASGGFLGGKLRNKKRAKECNPSTDADVGILACGTSQYCKENVDSLLGGFCVSQATLDEMQFSRRAQDDSGDSFNALTPEILCTHQDFQCLCNGFDLTAGTGSIPCILYEDIHKACSDDIVYSLTRTFTFNANVTEIAYSCLDVSSPYTRQVCFTEAANGGGDGVPACEYSVDGIVCDKCSIIPSGDDCTVFDCTNTIPEGQDGKNCAGEFPVPIMKVIRSADVSCVNATKISSNCLFGDELLDRTCDCTGIDYETLTGSFHCEYVAATCIDATNSTCSTSSFSYSRGPEGETVDQNCFDLFTPYEQSWCYGMDSLQPDLVTCSVDSIDCTSCIPDYAANCFSFDCTNTPVENAGTCNYILPVVDAILNPMPAPVVTASPVLVTGTPVTQVPTTTAPTTAPPTDGAVSSSQATTALSVGAALVAYFIM
jgi:hypothetical protein